MDGIFTQHVGLDLLDLFEDGFFVLIIIFIEFITVGLDSVSDKIEDFVGHVSFTDSHWDLLIVPIWNLSYDGIETFEVFDWIRWEVHL